MKVQVKNCTECRTRIHKEEQEQYLKKQYTGIKDAIFTIACLSTAATLAVQVQRGRSRAYIQKLFQEICMMYETSEILGKPIVLTDIIRQLENDYEIDFSRINVNFNESEKEFIKNCKEAAKK